VHFLQEVAQMNRTRLVVVPLALVLAVAGCGAPSRVAPAPSPTPSAVGPAEAATAFADTICTFNDAAFAFDTTWSDLEAPLRDLQAAASLSRTEAETAKQGLQAVTWPADIADDVLVIEEYLDERIEKLDSVVSARAVEELDGIDFTTPDGVNTAAAEVEAFLELGADYCPDSGAGDGSDPAAELSSSAWSGTDSDGDDTELLLEADGSASVTVAAAQYGGTWKLADGLLAVDASRPDNSLAFSGVYEPGADSMNLSGTATNGHSWTVLLQRR
jgi:hypothetical protein